MDMKTSLDSFHFIILTLAPRPIWLMRCADEMQCGLVRLLKKIDM